MDLNKDYFDENKESFINLLEENIESLSFITKKKYNNFISEDKKAEIISNIKVYMTDIELNHSIKSSFNLIFYGIKSYHESYQIKNLDKLILSEKKRNKNNKSRFLFKSMLKDSIKFLSKNGNNEDSNNFYYFWVGLVLIDTISEYSIDILDNDGNDINSKNIKNKNVNSKLFFLEKILVKIESLFLILSIGRDLHLKFDNLSKEYYSHMLLFLQEKQYINSYENIVSFEGSISYNVKYGIKIDNNIENKSSFSVLNLISFKNKKIYENPINIIKNKNFQSDNFPIKNYVSLSSNLFDTKPLIKINKRYGFVTQEGKKINPNDMYIEENSVFIEFCKNKALEEFSIDLKFFEDVFIYLIEKVGLSTSLNLNSDINELYDLLISYKFVESNENKNNLQDILRLIEMINIYKVFKKKNKFYFSFFFDFRSRMYYDSICSLTNFKLSRFFLTSKDYSKKELNEIIENTKKTKSYDICLNLYYKYKDKFEKYLDYSFIKELNEDEKDYEDFKKIIVINILLYLGATKKSKILTTKSSYSIRIEEFLEESIIILRDYSKDSDFLKKIKDEEDYFKLKFSINTLKTEFNLYKKFYIGLDFSASGHQLRYIQNIFNDIDNYKLINMNSIENEWYDIYTYFIKGFIEFFKSILKKNPSSIKRLKNLKYKKIEEIIKDLEKEKIMEFSNNVLNNTFKRSILKKSIMTTGYNVSFHQFKEYYKKEVEDNNLIKFIDLNANEKNVLNFILFLFYNFCNNPNLYLDLEIVKDNKELENILSHFLNYKIIHLDGFKTSFAAFKEKKEDIRTIYWYKKNSKMFRITLKHKNYSNEIDLIKTQNSLIPNFIHSIDAVLLRFIIYFKWWSTSIYFTIHDEYWLPIQEKLLFIDHLNFIMKRNLIVYEEDLKKKDSFFIKEFINSREKFESFIEELCDLKDKRTERFFSFFIII